MNDFTFTYERKFSDGNYGSEGFSLSLSISDATLTDEQALDYAHHLRRTVLSFLGGSAATQVARAASRELHPPMAPKAAEQPMSDEAYFDAMADARSY